MGLDLLIGASAILRDRGLKFRVYIGGKGPLRETLQEQIQSSGLRDFVQLLGELSEEQLSLAYGAADAFVIPTRALECFGLIAVEAMAAGAPVLSTPVGALPEIISQIEPRWLSRDASATAIADVMSEFIKGTLPVHGSEEIRQFVESRYSEQNALERYVRTATGEKIDRSRPQE
jgi:glycosyltransferase involved in cell wall biosynthesis